MVESIQNRFYHRLNQLQIESTMNRFNYELNLPMVESTYGCREGRKSKKVKNPADCRTLALYQTKVQDSSRIPGQSALNYDMGLYGWVLRAGELESWACELEAGAASWKLNCKFNKAEAGSWDCYKNLTAVEPL